MGEQAVLIWKISLPVLVTDLQTSKSKFLQIALEEIIVDKG